MTAEEREDIELAMRTFCDASSYPMYVASRIDDKRVRRFVGELTADVIARVHHDFKKLMSDIAKERPNPDAPSG